MRIEVPNQQPTESPKKEGPWKKRIILFVVLILLAGLIATAFLMRSILVELGII